MAWMAGPRYLCRKKLIKDTLNNVNPEKTLEIGFGNGELITSLSRKYNVKGIDFSKEAFLRLDEITKKKGMNLDIENASSEDLIKRNESFDCVMAFEVLEHIEEDMNELKKWNTLLKEKGYLLISVPAHMKMWGGNDDYAGHLRRYERKELSQKVVDAGFEVLFIHSYGYPIVNIAKIFRDSMIKRRIKKGENSTLRTKKSGIDNISFEGGRYIFNDNILLPFYIIQKLFLKTELGTGYLCLARKNNN